MILLIDNYDSFTYNLVQYFQCLEQEIVVYKNDALSLQDIEKYSTNAYGIIPRSQCARAGRYYAGCHQEIP